MMIDFNTLWPKYGIKPYGVLHLGGNTGQEAEAYYNLNVKEVIWVEAIPSVYAELLNNVKDIPGSICINACIGEEEGKEVEFHISNNEAQSSSYLELGHHKIIHPSVHYIDSFKTKIERGDKLFKDFKIEGDWFLNADLQGSELQAFKGMGNLLNNFQWIYSEINFKECYIGGALVDEIDTYLSKFGFHGTETGPVVGGTWTDRLYCKGDFRDLVKMAAR